jgi:CrcB protein
MSAEPTHEPDVQLQHHDNRVLGSPAARADDARRESVGSLIARHESVSSASSLASVDRPPSKEEGTPAPKVYAPLSLPVLALLAPASVFGVLARLGLQALATYDGESIFPLAYPQVVGCFIMGFLLPLKGPMGEM